MVVQNFFEMNLWVQYAIVVLPIVAGVYVLMYKKHSKKSAEKNTGSYYVLGFTLSVINPSVLLYWIVICSILVNFLGEGFQDSSSWLVLFLAGVFLGKFSTLYGYSKLGLHFQKKNPNHTNDLDAYIGGILLLLELLQIGKLIFF